MSFVTFQKVGQECYFSLLKIISVTGAYSWYVMSRQNYQTKICITLEIKHFMTV